MAWSKYKNKKVSAGSETFDSIREYRRYCELVLLEKNGNIKNLRRQVKFELIPSQKINGRVAERACTYVADFVYDEDGQEVVEDCKGMRTEVYKIKRKLMLDKYGVQIKET